MINILPRLMTIQSHFLLLEQMLVKACTFVERLECDAATKLTGMLLEMDQSEVLHPINSPEALKAKMAEA
ncbi:hypothetical protein V6N13_043620 [Hibiscus sabdariffa]|uniref:PABC domain-containing protein n=1 Tax=Hibiscus sabdariffa TaxID=183260 RepID=A0ABR2RG41_9ROSI